MRAALTLSLVLLAACEQRPLSEASLAPLSPVLPAPRVGPALTLTVRPAAPFEWSGAELSSRLGRAVATLGAQGLRLGPARLQTASLTRGGATLPLARALRRSSSGDAELAGERYVEAFSAQGEQVEQRWRFETSPPGRGTLRIQVRTEGLTFLGSDAQGLRFHDGERTLRYSHGTWIPATGPRSPLQARWVAPHIELEVPAEVLANTQWPAVLDPTFGVEAPAGSAGLAPANGTQDGVGSASNGVHTLVAWRDASNIAAARLSSTGQVVDAPALRLSASASLASFVRVASNGTDFVVAWTDSGGFRASRVRANGSLVDSAPLVLVAQASFSAIEFNGSDYLVSWSDAGDVFAAVFNATTGALSGTQVISLDSPGTPNALNQRTPSLVRSGATVLAAWVDARGGFWAQRLGAGGALVGPNFQVLTTTTPGALALAARSTAPEFVVVASTGNELAARRVSAATGAVGAELVFNVGTTSPAWPAAIFEGNDLLVSFTDGADLRVARLLADGTVTPATVLETGLFNPLPSLARFGSSLVALFTKQTDIVAAWIDATGARTGAPDIVVSLGYSLLESAVVVWDGSQFLVGWLDSRGRTTEAWLTPVSRQGTPGTPVRVLSVSSRLSTLDLACVGSTCLAVGLDNVGAVWAQGVVAGVPIGATFAVDGASPGTRSGASVVSSGGRFVVLYRAAQRGTHAVRVDLDGGVFDRPPLTLRTDLATSPGTPRAVSTGTSLLVSSGAASSLENGVVWGVTPALVSLGAADVPIGSASPATLAFDGTRVMTFFFSAISGPGLQRVTPAGTADGVAQRLPSSFRESAACFDGRHTLYLSSSGDLTFLRFDARGNQVDAAALFASGSRPAAPPSCAGDGQGRTLAVYLEIPTVGAPQIVTRIIDNQPGASGQALGVACAFDSECGSGNCIDRVCCATACGGGTSFDCQACDRPGNVGSCSLVDAGAVCRGARTSTCDVAEVCSGASAQCPADVSITAGVSCRAAAGPCDVAEACDGLGFCPRDVFADAGVVCGTDAGACRLLATCTGGGATCPANPARTGICRPSGGACDVAESCTASNNECPPDRLMVAGEPCRAAAGACDVAEACTGVAPTCPADALVDAGVTCRPALEACDVAEACSGVSSTCPADALADAGVTCRPASDACDVVEACSGLVSTCPADLKAGDGLACGLGSECRAGLCQAADAGADRDAGVTDAGFNTPDAGGLDAGGPGPGGSDAGTTTDAGATPGPIAGSCGCTMVDPTAVLLAALGVLSRRRRLRSHRHDQEREPERKLSTH